MTEGVNGFVFAKAQDELSAVSRQLSAGSNQYTVDSLQ
jgi:hypothetical protein